MGKAKLNKKSKKLIKNKKRITVKRKEKIDVSKHKEDNENAENALQNCDPIPEKLEAIADMSNDDETTKAGTSEEKVQRKIKGRAEHRSEPSQNISEFNLTETGKEKVKLDDLIKTSQKLNQLVVKKQLRNAKKLKSLSIPLDKSQLEKIKRTVAYDKVCDEVAKWDVIVKSNRHAEQMVYPLKKPEFYLESFEAASERFVSKHPVEEAVSKLLQTSENVLDEKRTLTVAEEKALQAMSLEEAKLRHDELMKHRALVSYKVAKARWRNKIKSKSYHRILKREKLKKMMKEFEELQKTDAAAALEKFHEADKLRIVERMTLKHRNTGKWAKQQKIRAKYNPESRSNLKEDLLIGKSLREKINAQIPLQQNERYEEIDPEDRFFEDPSESFLMEEVPFQSNSAKRTISNVVDYVTSQAEMKIQKSENAVERVSKIETNSSKLLQASNSVDEMALSSNATCLNSLIPDDISSGDEDLDDREGGRMTIKQAFADDDLIAEFQEEKKTAEKANKLLGTDLYLPGWGSWGGPGIKDSKRKRKRFFIKPLEPQIKKDTLGNVIINDEADKKASLHQVSHLPFPFSNVRQFQSSIRQPIGHTWNPQSSFQSLNAPKIITKMGKIIDPIDSEDVQLEKKGEDKDIKEKVKEMSKELKAF